MDVSIIIRAKNEAAAIMRVIRGIAAQRYNGSYEIVVVDSGSTDATVAICRSMGCRIVHLPPERFSWGVALNLGLRRSTGNFLVNLSAHAIPADTRWLERLIAPLAADSRNAAVYGRQLPVQEMDPFEGVELDLWFPPGDAPCVAKDLSNANCAIRREVWQRWPFDEIVMSNEDYLWACMVSAKGYTILYEPRSRVYHNHPFNLTANTSGIYLRWYWRSRTLAELIPPGTDHTGLAAVLAFTRFLAYDACYFKKNGQWRKEYGCYNNNKLSHWYSPV